MVATKSRPIPCDALPPLRYISTLINKIVILYSSLLPWWPSRLEIFFRCSQDVFRKNFHQFIDTDCFRAWLRVTDPSIRTYQQNIWTRATFSTRKWKWYPSHRNKNKFHHWIPCCKTTRSINNSVGMRPQQWGMFDIICKFIQMNFTAKMHIINP